MYGSSAIGGTINIFTKKGREGKHYNYDILRGSNGTTNLNASFDGTEENHDFYIGFNKIKTDGISAMNAQPNVNYDDRYANQRLQNHY